MSTLAPLGTIIDTHGLRGELKVRTHPADRDALLQASRVTLKSVDQALLPLVVVKARPNKAYVVVQFKGLDHVSQVADLVGRELLVDSVDIRREPGQFFWFELEGLQVFDVQRGSIGTLDDMFVTAAHGIYVVQGRFGEVMIPAIAPFVLGLDREENILRVDVPDGLYPENQ